MLKRIHAFDSVSLIESSFEIVLQFHKADISIQTKKTAEANFTCAMWY